MALAASLALLYRSDGLRTKLRLGFVSSMLETSIRWAILSWSSVRVENCLIGSLPGHLNEPLLPLHAPLLKLSNCVRFVRTLHDRLVLFEGDCLFYRIVSRLSTRNGGEIHYPRRSVYQSKDSGPLGNGAVIDMRDCLCEFRSWEGVHNFQGGDSTMKCGSGQSRRSTLDYWQFWLWWSVVCLG